MPSNFIPFNTASCRGELRRGTSIGAFTLALRSIKILATSIWPLAHASHKGVAPSIFVALI